MKPTAIGLLVCFAFAATPGLARSSTAGETDGTL